MRFEHAWESNECCDKCKNVIGKNAYFYTRGGSVESFVFCDPCYCLLENEIDYTVYEFIGKSPNPKGVITNDDAAKYLLKDMYNKD